MTDVWLFMVLFLAGIGLCLLVGRWIVRRWRLPLRQALIYFGLLPHPDEVALPPKPSRRELAKRRQRAERRIERSRTRKPPTPPTARP
jgi:hypothetical protein